MAEAKRKPEQEVAALLAQGARLEAAELARPESRLRGIREAKAALEAEAQAAAAAEMAKAKLAKREHQVTETGRKPKGRPPRVLDPPQMRPAPKAQRNFTDPEPRMMKDGATKSFVQAYNAQPAVDSAAQGIVAAAVTQEASDTQQFVLLQQQVEANLGQKPTQASADAGYFSEPNLTDADVDGIELHVPPDRQKHGALPLTGSRPAPPVPTVIGQMRHKPRTTEGQALYRRRKAILEVADEYQLVFPQAPRHSHCRCCREVPQNPDRQVVFATSTCCGSPPVW